MSRSSWWRWIVLPWRSPAVALALVSAFALPALLLTSGPVFRTAAADRITTGVLDDLAPVDAGLVVQSEGPFDTERLPSFDRALGERLDRIDGLGSPELTLLSDRVTLAAVDGVALGDSGNLDDLRVMARPGAADAVELVGGERGDGVLVPTSLADEHGIEPGTTIAVGTAQVLVTGIYRDLWAGERDPYWDRLPFDMLPRFVSAFNAPTFELLLADDGTARSLGLTGRARWETSLDDPPRSWDAFRALDRSYRQAASALDRTGPVNDAFRSWARDPEVPPSSFTAVGPAFDEAGRVIRELEPPVRASTRAGTAVGVVLSTLGAVFLLRRHRREFRLLAADGDAAWRFFGRATAQYLPPALVGLVLGTTSGWAVVRVLGPSGTASWSVVPFAWLIGVTIIGVAAAGVVTAAIAIRLTDSMDAPVGAIRPAWIVVLLGIAATMWVQVGRERTGDVNPLIVAFPLVGVVSGVLLTVLLLRELLRRSRRSGGGLPTPLFLAWRALTASETGALALTAAVGSAAGLAVLSVSFVDSIDRATTAKATTVVGAASRLDTIDSVDPDVLPEGSTLVLRRTTRIDDLPVDVIAIAPDTFASAVAWSGAFGTTPGELLAMLDAGPGTDAVPAVVVGSLPAIGEFGVQRVFPYRSVGSVESVPTASTTSASLVIRADVFEEFARTRWEAALEPIDPVDQQAAEVIGRTLEYESPLRAFADTVLSTRPITELEALARQHGWRVTDALTLAGQNGDVDALATRWAFDYLGLLAVVGIVTAGGVLTFYLAERRRAREVTSVMTIQMGISRRTNMLAAVVEMVGLVIAAVTAGALAAAVTARRVFPSFEPDPSVPPTVGLALDATTIGLMLVSAIVLVAAVAAWSERRVSAADAARVLRG